MAREPGRPRGAPKHDEPWHLPEGLTDQERAEYGSLTPRQMKAYARDFEKTLSEASVQKALITPEMHRAGAITISTLLASKNPRHKTRGLAALHRAQRYNLDVTKLEMAYTLGLPVQRHEIRQDNSHLLDTLEKTRQQDLDAAGKIGRQFQRPRPTAEHQEPQAARRPTWDKPPPAKPPNSKPKGRPPKPPPRP